MKYKIAIISLRNIPADNVSISWDKLLPDATSSDLLHVVNHFVAVELRVTTARDVNPEVEVVGGFEDELVIVGVVFEEVEPLASLVHVGVTFAIVELVGSERQADVGSFSELVL